MVCPCKGCQDRRVTGKDRCHSTCSKYTEWKAYADEINRRCTSDKVRYYIIGDILFGRKPKT